MPRRNLELLIDAAELLRPLLDELVFVGGCTTALLVTDKAAAEVRPTYDIDAIAEITSYPDYVDFSGRLRKLGFTRSGCSFVPLAEHQHEAGCDAARRDNPGFLKPLVQACNAIC